MLIVLSGLPGTGKSTIAKALVARRPAVYVRLDEIENALRRHACFREGLDASGYVVAFAIASSNLKLGNTVVANSVNPVVESRFGWREVARAACDAGLLEVEVICSDVQEHRRRVESRGSDIEGLSTPTWSSVLAHRYVPWTGDRLVIDTAVHSVSEAVSRIERELERTGRAGR